MKLKKYIKLLTEVGDLSNIDPYEYNIRGLSTEFDTGIDKILVSFKKIDNFNGEVIGPPILYKDKESLVGYNIEYSINGEDTQYRKSDYSYLIKILKTVTNIIIDTILKNDLSNENIQNVYCIGSISKTGMISNDKQKDMMYREIAKNQLPTSYRILEIEFAEIGITGIAITKK